MYTNSGILWQVPCILFSQCCFAHMWTSFVFSPMYFFGSVLTLCLLSYYISLVYLFDLCVDISVLSGTHDWFINIFLCPISLMEYKFCHSFKQLFNFPFKCREIVSTNYLWWLNISPILLPQIIDINLYFYLLISNYLKELSSSRFYTAGTKRKRQVRTFL
jgi:hypothetical protein